jgi:hypothetical protein
MMGIENTDSRFKSTSNEASNAPVARTNRSIHTAKWCLDFERLVA